MPPLSRDEERWLLQLARRTVTARLAEDPLEAGRVEAEVPSELLHRPSGAFVTLEVDGALRGCVGFVGPELPLFQTVMEAAVSAAFRDPRFPPLQQDELEAISIEISVLSPLSLIRLEDIAVGTHGLVISQGTFRGLLLPRVAVERGWDRVRFLEETCLKAELPRDAWKTGAAISAFTAQAFSDASEQAA